MSASRRVAFACFAASAAVSLAFGVVYLASPRIMPYHLAALGVAWRDLAAAEQTVMLAILRVAGGGFLTAAVAMLFLLARPFRAGATWASWALLAVGLSMGLPSAYAVWLVTSRTSGTPPWPAAVASVALVLAGFAAAEGPRRAAARRVRHAHA